MKRFALALAFTLFTTLAHAQCNGVFPNNTVCGNVTGSSNLPRATSPSAFLGAAGGTNGQIQYNNAGALGGFTMSGDCTTNTGTGAITCTNVGNMSTGTLNTARLPSPFTNGTRSGNTSQFGTTTGTLTNGNCVKFDANGNLADAGFTCAASSVSGFTGSTICNLKDQMDAHYGVGGWSYRTTVGSGTDIGPAISDCITTFSGMLLRGTIYVPPSGTWALKTASIDLSGVYLIGAGSQASLIVANVSSGNAFWWRGTGGVTGGGMRGIGIFLESGIGTSTVNGIVLSGTSSFQPDQAEFNDIYMTSLAGATTWQNCLTVDGSARTSPQGVRVGYFTNIQLFQCNNNGALFNNVVQYTISNIGIYSSTGTGQDAFVSGGGSASTNSIQVVIDNIITRNLTVSNSSRFFIRGWGTSIIVNSTATLGIIQMQATPSGSCGTGCTVTTF